MLFSLAPLVAFIASVADLLLPDEQRDAVAGWLASVVPGHALDTRPEHALTASGTTATIAGLVSLAFLLWAANGMMAAIRVAFRLVRSPSISSRVCEGPAGLESVNGGEHGFEALHG
jgi:uncharacterized BrkB/YihY/UPF0761 family membrane protein